MITTNQLRVVTGEGRIITLWILSSVVALAFIAEGGAKPAGSAAMGMLEAAAGIGLLISRCPSMRLSRLPLSWLARSSCMESCSAVPCRPGRVVRPHRKHFPFTKP